MAEDREQSYRDKYLALLDEVDAKEQQWALLERKLPRVLSHLVIIAEGPANTEISAELMGLKDDLRERFDLEALESRVEALKERVVRESRWAEDVDLLPPVHQVLIHLIERLPLPPEMAEDAVQLVDDLEPGVAPDALPEAIDRIARLVFLVRARVQEEKRELENLLREVTDKLQSLDAGLSAAHREAEAGFAASRQFGDAVHAEVRDLEHSSRTADLETLRAAVRSTLESVQRHLDSQRQGEEQRVAALQREVDKLHGTVAELEQEVTEYREKTRKARELSLRDPLTGCLNRLAYQERAEAEEARWRRYGSPLSVVVFDLDRFKSINDSFGHKAGDQVLKAVAQIAGNQLRRVDFFGRYGGEEFVALLPETELEAARKAAEKVRSAVANFRFHSRGRRVPVTISAGVAQLGPGDTLDAAFQRADAALYRAKADGRNRCASQGEVPPAP